MKTALVFGSTGLVGGHLVKKLIKSNTYSKIKIFVRSDSEIKDSKIEIINTDFYNLENHKEDIKGDHCFVCIGTTKKNAPKSFKIRLALGEGYSAENCCLLAEHFLNGAAEAVDV